MEINKAETDRERYDFKEKMAAAVKQLIEVKFLTAGGITKKQDGRAGTERVWVKRTGWKEA
ncbi:hypothetical protein [Burkholderia lata]|uniref:hypothetical protein n=1 Tax=Burkholderia lata (strain ATCC 17760 / DSM 23089 / LMG 22485 / NCIMB 9086 / R18194 / 383) TaxID=482957 RepID=UPI00158312D9|nr:hypothetical protein [Burkholderia lata]